MCLSFCPCHNFDVLVVSKSTWKNLLTFQRHPFEITQGKQGEPHLVDIPYIDNFFPCVFLEMNLWWAQMWIMYVPHNCRSFYENNESFLPKGWNGAILRWSIYSQPCPFNCSLGSLAARAFSMGFMKMAKKNIKLDGYWTIIVVRWTCGVCVST